MSSTTEIYLRGRIKDAIYELHSFVCDYALPSYDRWNTKTHLHLDGMTINRGLKEHLVRFLNLPLARDPTDASDKQVRWIYMTIEELDLYHVDSFPANLWDVDDEDCMTNNDAYELCSAIASQTLRLKITRSSSLLSYILDVFIERFMAERLHIEETESLTNDQYYTLGNMIARSVELTELYLRLPLYDYAHQVFDGLATAFNIQELSLHDGYMPDTGEGELIIGRDGPLIKLLQHPQNQLKKLSLVNFGMKDKHLNVISELLPKSQIEFFDFSKNLIQS